MSSCGAAATPAKGAGEGSDDLQRALTLHCGRMLARRGPGAHGWPNVRAAARTRPDGKQAHAAHGSRDSWYSRRARLRKLRRHAGAPVSLHCAKAGGCTIRICWPARLPDGTCALAREALNACRAVSRGGFTAGVGAASLPIDGHRVCLSWAATHGHLRASFSLCHQVPRLSPHRAGR